MKKLDLHIHSAYSDDGEFTVKEIMELCKNSEITYMSITDHNTVKAIPEALALGAGMGIQVIAGVELDCVHMGRNFHLLGYHFDHTRPVFAEIEQHILEQEQHEALLPYLPGNTRGTNPYVNFYWDYFSQGKPAYVPIDYITLHEAIDIIHAAGGITVLAHPNQNLQHEYALFWEFVNAGIDGVEAYSSYHGRVASSVYETLAQENKLLVTCGSDFHGKTKPGISLCQHGAEENMSAIITSLEDACIINR